MKHDCRRLTDADVPLMREMLAMFGEAFEDAGSYASRPPRDSYLAELLARETFVAVAAMHNVRVVGGLSAYVLDKVEQERREIYIYDLAVAEPYRRQGIATALVIELKRIAQAMGAYVIFVQADLADAPAIALYRSLGHEETAHHYDIDVE